MKAEAEAQGVSHEDAKNNIEHFACSTLRQRHYINLRPLPGNGRFNALQMVQLQTRIELWGEGENFITINAGTFRVDRASSANHVIKGTYPVSGMTLEF